MVFDCWTKKEYRDENRNLFNFYFNSILIRRAVDKNCGKYIAIATLKEDIIIPKVNRYAVYFYDNDSHETIFSGRLIFNCKDLSVAKFKADIYLQDLGHELIEPYWGGDKE